MPPRYIPAHKSHARKRIRVRCLGPCKKEHWFLSNSKFHRVCERGSEIMRAQAMRCDPAHWMSDPNIMPQLPS
jgi:hypothetical protein